MTNMIFEGTNNMKVKTTLRFTGLITVLLLAACGGGDNASNITTAPITNEGGSPIMNQPGSIIESEPVQLFVLPGVPFPGKSHKIKYRSTDHNGRSVVITGTVTTPLLPWKGPGQRPIVSFAIGTHGVGDACAPSRLMAQGTDYEAATIPPLLLQGYGVVITDYVGSGTDEPSTYINRLAQGHAVLDAIRAAQQLTDANLPKNGPVAVFGYSQGGHGAGAAAELQPSYAPELQLIGAYAGSIPSDFRAVVNLIDGGIYAGLMGNFINGLQAAFPENNLMEKLNVTGKKFAQDTSEQCVPVVVAPHLLTQSRRFFSDGRSLADHLNDPIWQAPMRAQFLGQSRPSAPLFVAQSIADDVIPFASTRDTAKRWCDLGATVQFSVVPVPGHVPAAPVAAAQALLWLGNRVAGIPAPNNCGSY